MNNKYTKVTINGKSFDLDMEAATSAGVLTPSVQLAAGDVYEFAKAKIRGGANTRVTLIRRVNGSWLLSGYGGNAFSLLDVDAQNEEGMIEWLRSNYYVKVGHSRLTVEA